MCQRSSRPNLWPTFLRPPIHPIPSSQDLLEKARWQSATWSSSTSRWEMGPQQVHSVVPVCAEELRGRLGSVGKKSLFHVFDRFLMQSDRWNN